MSERKTEGCRSIGESTKREGEEKNDFKPVFIALKNNEPSVINHFR
jgi:hypothetical protein